MKLSKKIARRWQNANKLGFVAVACATISGTMLVNSALNYMDRPEPELPNPNCLSSVFDINGVKDARRAQTPFNTVVTGTLRDGQLVALSNDFHTAKTGLVRVDGKKLRRTVATRRLMNDAKISCVPGARVLTAETTLNPG